MYKLKGYGLMQQMRMVADLERFRTPDLEYIEIDFHALYMSPW
jgi:hypothetical protein